MLFLHRIPGCPTRQINHAAVQSCEACSTPERSEETAGPYNHGLGLCDYGLLLPDILGTLPAAVGGNCAAVTAAAATPLQHRLVLGRLAGEITPRLNPMPMQTLRDLPDLFSISSKAGTQDRINI